MIRNYAPGLSCRRKPPARAALLLFVSALCLAAAAPAEAGTAGSYHDFSFLAFAPAGPCTACHRVHYAVDPRGLWPRDLSDEEDTFLQAADPDYLPPQTLLCYDCHAEQLSVDLDPTGWIVGDEPQDIAFTDGPGENSPGDFVGYYELSDGSLPNGTNAPTDGTPTGGHYWKSEPTGTPDYARGDKLPCTLCHDPHDEETGAEPNKNEAMFRAEADDGSGGVIDLGDSLTASANTRHGTGNGRGMCAACHGYSDGGSPAVMWGVTLPSPSPGVPEHASVTATPCTDCHRHNFVAPTGCEGCHGAGGNVHAGLDGIPGNGDDAPNVISVLEGGSWLSVWDGSWWDAVMGGSDAVQQGGHGDPDGKAAVGCSSCHDTGIPADTHMDGTVNSAETGTNPNANTAHLLSSFIGTSSPAYDVQLTLDGACLGCHTTSGVKEMTHERDGDPVPGAVEFGQHLTIADGTSISYPIDSDLSTNAPAAQPNYAPCVSCHNPHGTTETYSKGSPSTKSNLMMRARWKSPSVLCVTCHQ